MDIQTNSEPAAQAYAAAALNKQRQLLIFTTADSARKLLNDLAHKYGEDQFIRPAGGVQKSKPSFDWLRKQGY